MKKVFVYSGLPGSGKSTIIARDHANADVCSADHYFTKPDGTYAFDPSKLGEAHGQCIRRFVSLLHFDRPEIVVDNTNTTTAEIAPYAALALSYGYDLQIVTVECDPEVAARRNVHGVSREAILRMSEVLDRRELMPWWDTSVVFTDGGES